MLVFGACLCIILNLVAANSKCKSFSDCHALGLSTMKKIKAQNDLKWVFHIYNLRILATQGRLYLKSSFLRSSMKDCVGIYDEEKCLQMIFNNDYFWSKWFVRKIGFIKVFDKKWTKCYITQTNFTFVIAFSSNYFHNLSKFLLVYHMNLNRIHFLVSGHIFQRSLVYLNSHLSRNIFHFNKAFYHYFPIHLFFGLDF